MWIFTDNGFVSAVRKADNPTVLTVRARDRKSLESLVTQTGVEIAQSPNADYPYRVFVKQDEFAQWAFELSMNVNYNNFKNQVAKIRGHEFAKSLNNVWLSMLDVEDEQARTNEETKVLIHKQETERTGASK